MTVAVDKLREYVFNLVENNANDEGVVQLTEDQLSDVLTYVFNLGMDQVNELQAKK